MNIRFGSVCSGIDMASVAWNPLGWKAAYFSEIDSFPCAVLNHHYPDIPNLGDLTKIHCIDNERGIYTHGDGEKSELGKVDVMVGGTPCFPADTPVLTPNGYVPIQSLKVGDFVISGEGVKRRVEAIGAKESDVGTVDILGRGKITCTANHPFLTIGRDTCTKRIRELDWIKTKAEDSVKRRVALLTCNCEHDAPTDDTKIAELAGWFIRCGVCFEKMSATSPTVMISLKKEDSPTFLRGKLLEGIRCDEVAYTDGGRDIYITDDSIKDWIVTFFTNRMWGEKRYVKTVHPGIFSSKTFSPIVNSFRIGVLGRRDSDILRDIPDAATAYGIADAFKESVVIRKENVIGRKRMNDRFDVIIKSPVSITREYKNDDRVIFGHESAFIRGFEHGTGRTTVYNITVAKDHTYIVCGCIVGNCQSFSWAGKREGLGGVSGLVRSYFELLKEVRPKVFIWENVKGSLSVDKGSAFKFVIDAFTSLGYSCAWRLLDSQYVRVDGFPGAVPQRRQRVFVVGCLGTSWECPAEILLEPECEHWDNPPMRREEEGTGREVPCRIGIHGKLRTDVGPGVVEGVEFETKVRRSFFDYHGNDCRVTKTDVAPTIAACNGDHLEGKELLTLDEITIPDNFNDAVLRFEEPTVYVSDGESKSYILCGSDNIEKAISGRKSIPLIRKLIPEEAEVFMGLPRGYTRIPFRGKSAGECRNALRFKACGNGFTVNVMRWIGRRIERAAKKYNLFEKGVL